jgi:peptide/nickel transport system substrate-binding protein
MCVHKRLLLFLPAVLVAAVLVVPSFAQQSGGTLIIGRGSDSVTLSYYANAAPDAEVIAHINETLFKLTPEGKIEPLLAESHRLSADGKSLTINLRRGIQFHDGTPFDANAVKWNLDFFLDPNNRVGYRFLVSEVTAVNVIDSSTVQLVSGRPFVPLLAHLTHDFIAMHSPAAVQKAGGMRPPTGMPYGGAPVGTGPYKFKEWVRGDRLVLERNAGYWGPKKPVFEQIVWRVIPDDGARVLALESGQIHVAVRIPPRETSRLALNRALRVDRTSSLRTIYMAFNNQRRPFTDVRVRQAFNYAVNKRAIVQTILGGAARVSDAPIAPGIVGYSPVMSYPYDPNKAKQLLAEAGFGSGLNVTLHHPTGRYVQDAAVAAAVQAQLREAGVNARLVTMEWATYLQATGRPVDQTDIEMLMIGWGTVTGDADYGLYSLFHSSQWQPAGNSRFFYKSADVDRLLDEARAITDPAKRAATYKQAMEIVMKDAPWLFLHSESQITGMRREVTGLLVHPTERVLAYNAQMTR